jgi:hypothetical protein
MSYDPNEDPNKANLFHSYRKGWTAGARIGPLDPKFTEHDNADIKAEYERGYKDGRIANRDALQAASDRTGYKPSVLRLAGGE